jgi:ABC-type multidrug transport system fused ATPase/permease subunit
VLDEPTSHLDEHSETAVLAALATMRERATVVVVSHRVRVAETADRVVLLKGGRVIEQGRPGELLARDGAFRRLAASAPASPEPSPEAEP